MTTAIWMACGAMLLFGCPKSDSAADAGKKAPAAGDADGKKGAAGPVGSVYPASPAPSADAEALCKTMQETARVRRGECCQSKPGVLLTKECTRVVSGAVELKSIAIDAGKLKACSDAMAAQHEGCEWVGSWSRPTPRECGTIVTGKLEAESACRSSLECSPSLRCHGVSPTQAGTCGAPLKSGATCSRGADPLASYLAVDLDAQHPECAGFCGNGRCRDIAKPGGRCVSNEHCGPAHHCAADGVCKEGTEGAVGSACLGEGCVAGARCVSGTCQLPKAKDAACTADAECTGACLKAEGKEAGVCGMRCTQPGLPPKKG